MIYSLLCNGSKVSLNKRNKIISVTMHKEHQLQYNPLIVLNTALLSISWIFTIQPCISNYSWIHWALASKSAQEVLRQTALWHLVNVLPSGIAMRQLSDQELRRHCKIENNDWGIFDTRVICWVIKGFLLTNKARRVASDVKGTHTLCSR